MIEDEDDWPRELPTEEMEAALKEYKEAKLKQIKGKIHLVSRDSHLKGDMYDWICQLEKPDGTFIDGYVQATGDGNMIAPESFEPNEL